MTPSADRHQLFISYSRADREWVDRLKTMLAPLLRGNDLRLWDDSKIAPGELWKEEIAGALAAAKVALLLVSPDFLNSDFIHSEELPPLLRAAQEEGLVLLWVKLRPCMVHRTPIHAFQAALDPARPLVALAPWEQEAALETMAQRIEAAFQQANNRDHQPEVNRKAREPQELQAPSAATPAPALSPPSGLTRQRLSQNVWGVVEELVPGVALQLVEIPAGRFSMGSPPGEEGRDRYALWAEEWKRLAAVKGADVEAQRLVTVPSFWLGRYPITQAQWQVVAGWPRWIGRWMQIRPASKGRTGRWSG
ncbi:MAG: TIR domain-containing protein [Cyanobium sp.]